jgi:hypothetical protein
MLSSFRVAIGCMLLLRCYPSLAQVTILNPQHLEVPEQRVEVLLHATCQVVAQEFHRGREEIDFPLVLVLGDPNERYTSDEEHRLYTIYLYRWNEVQFAVSAMRLAVQRMVTQSRRDRIVTKILKRSNSISTVSIYELRSRQIRVSHHSDTRTGMTLVLNLALSECC